MQQQMGVQTVLVGEILAAVHAHVWSFTSMDTSMCRKMMLQQEGLSALIARVGTLLGNHVRRGRIRVVDIFIIIDFYRLQFR